MRITPLDIQHKVFKAQFRGYHMRQVNHFLDEIAESMETLTRENTALREKLATRDEELADLRKAEAALTSTLVSTQNFTEQLKQGAHQDADLIVKEAELKAAEMLSQSQTQLSDLQRTLAELRRERLVTLERMRSTLKTFERILEIEEGDSSSEQFRKPVEPPTAPSSVSDHY